MSLKLKLTFVLVFAFAVLMVIYGVSALTEQYQAERARTIELTQTICSAAHKEIDATSDHACGLVQEVTNTEFLCNKVDTVCWTEAK